MAIKHIILKSGERLVADLQEAYTTKLDMEGNEVQVVSGFYLGKPCSVNVIQPGEGPEGPMDGPPPERQPGPEKTAIDISLYPWIPFGKGEVVPVPLDWVVTYVDPVDMLYEMYEKNVLEATEWNVGMNYRDEEETDCQNCRN